MPDVLTVLAFLELLSQGEKKSESKAPAGPAPAVPVATAPPGTTAPMPAWTGTAPAPVPTTLPAFPGPGWVPDIPLVDAVIARAAFWNAQLWDTAKKTIVKPLVQEQFGGRWLTFVAAWHPGAQGAQTFMATEAWRLATDLPLPVTPAPVVTPPPAAIPGVPAAAPGVAAKAATAGTVVMPLPVGPEPAMGAWKTNAAFIARYQTALAFLATSKSKPAWSPGAVDGKYGPKSGAAVLAFQKDHPTLKADGQCGNQTAAVLDAELGYGAVPPKVVPQPVPVASVAPSPVVAPAPIPTPAATPGAPAVPLPPPAAVSPYPGPGAWQTHTAYIARYQSALTYLARGGFCPCDPQGVDGKFGPNTKLAVMAFQKEAQLTQDGECGASTATALDQAVHNVASSAPPPVVTSGEVGRGHRGRKHKHGKRPAPPAPPDGGGGDDGGDDSSGGGDAATAPSDDGSAGQAPPDAPQAPSV